eukprot:4932988-Prymnesium_polylepis.2
MLRRWLSSTSTDHCLCNTTSSLYTDMMMHAATMSARCRHRCGAPSQIDLAGVADAQHMVTGARL